MASSGKTEKLGLSLWEAGDRPQRLDFRQDNELLESLVGSHIADKNLHLTAAEKKFAHNGVYTAYYTGTGAETLKLAYDNAMTMPRLVIILPQAGAPVTIADGKLSIYFALGCYKYGGTKGLTVEQKTFSLKQDPENGCCLNERGKRYAIIMIP